MPHPHRSPSRKEGYTRRIRCAILDLMTQRARMVEVQVEPLADLVDLARRAASAIDVDRTLADALTGAAAQVEAELYASAR